jgi:hypothetical protein
LVASQFSGRGGKKFQNSEFVNVNGQLTPAECCVTI